MLRIRGQSHVPSFKNSKMLLVRQRRLITKPEYQRWMEQAVRSVVKKAGLALADIDWVVPHQANARIIETVGDRLGVSRVKVFQNIERYGNTSAASIPLCTV